jgi:hypothetical protein
MAPVQNPGATQVQIDLHPFPGVAQVQFFWVEAKAWSTSIELGSIRH